MLLGFGSDKQSAAQNQVPEHTLNIVVFGDSQVGKTSLLEEYCSFKNDNATIDRTPGIELHVKKLRYRQSVVTTTFYDFGGDNQQRYPLEVFVKQIISQSVTSSDEFPFAAIMTVFDCGSQHSIYQMKAWLKWFYYACLDINSKLKRDLVPGNFEKKLADLPVIVLANKVDVLSAEPFFYFELGRQPWDQRDALASYSENACKKLKAHLCMDQCENLAFTSAECNPVRLSDVMDRVIIAVHEKTTHGITREEFDVCGISLSRSLKGSGFQEELLKAGWISKLLGLFSKKDTPELPL